MRVSLSRERVGLSFLFLELRGLPGLRGLQRLPGLPGLELRGERVGLSFLFLDDGSLAGRQVGRVGWQLLGREGNGSTAPRAATAIWAEILA